MRACGFEDSRAEGVGLTVLWGGSDVAPVPVLVCVIVSEDGGELRPEVSQGVRLFHKKQESVNCGHVQSFWVV